MMPNLGASVAKGDIRRRKSWTVQGGKSILVLLKCQHAEND